MDKNSRQLRKEETRQRLISAARRVLKRRGLTRTTTREIAREAGVAAGTFFVHFSEVGSLVESLLDMHLEHALKHAMRTLPHEGDIVQQLVHVSRRLYDSYDAEPELSRAYLSATLFMSNPARPTQMRLDEFRRWVETRIQEAVARGELPAIDAQLAFAGFFSLYFGALVAGLRGQLNRRQQVGLLEAALRRLLRLEAKK